MGNLKRVDTHLPPCGNRGERADPQEGDRRAEAGNTPKPPAVTFAIGKHPARPVGETGPFCLQNRARRPFKPDKGPAPRFPRGGGFRFFCPHKRTCAHAKHVYYNDGMYRDKQKRSGPKSRSFEFQWGKPPRPIRWLWCSCRDSAPAPTRGSGGSPKDSPARSDRGSATRATRRDAPPAARKCGRRPAPTR